MDLPPSCRYRLSAAVARAGGSLRGLLATFPDYVALRCGHDGGGERLRRGHPPFRSRDDRLCGPGGGRCWLTRSPRRPPAERGAIRSALLPDELQPGSTGRHLGGHLVSQPSRHPGERAGPRLPSAFVAVAVAASHASPASRANCRLRPARAHDGGRRAAAPVEDTSMTLALDVAGIEAIRSRLGASQGPCAVTQLRASRACHCVHTAPSVPCCAVVVPA